MVFPYKNQWAKAHNRRTLMKNKVYCLGILVIVLVFGMSVIGCDNGTTNEANPFDGTWARGTDRLIISGTNYTFRSVFGGSLIDVSKGTFIADLSATSGTFAVNQTHEINSSNGQLEPYVQTETGTFSIVGNTMIFAGFSYFPINGTWTK